MVRISRASRRRAERERKKREKKPKRKSSEHNHTSEHIEPSQILCIPWNEESPKCPNCGSDWNDEGVRFSCHNCGRFIMKTDLVIDACERCSRQFIWDELEAWVDLEDKDYEEQLLCNDCMTAVFIKGDTQWLKKNDRL